MFLHQIKNIICSVMLKMNLKNDSLCSEVASSRWMASTHKKKQHHQMAYLFYWCWFLCTQEARVQTAHPTNSKISFNLLYFPRHISIKTSKFQWHFLDCLFWNSGASVAKSRCKNGEITHHRAEDGFACVGLVLQSGLILCGAGISRRTGRRVAAALVIPGSGGLRAYIRENTLVEMKVLSPELPIKCHSLIGWKRKRLRGLWPPRPLLHIIITIYIISKQQQQHAQPAIMRLSSLPPHKKRHSHSLHYM